MLGWNSVSKLSHKRLFVFLGTCATVLTSLNKSTFLTSRHGDLIQLGQRRDAGYNKLVGEGKAFRSCICSLVGPCFCAPTHWGAQQRSGEKVKEGTHQRCPQSSYDVPAWIPFLITGQMLKHQWCVSSYQEVKAPKRSVASVLTMKGAEGDWLRYGVFVLLGADKFDSNHEVRLDRTLSNPV